MKSTIFEEYLLSLKINSPIVPLSKIAELQKKTWKPSNKVELLEHYSIPAYDRGQFPTFDISTEIKSNKTSVSPDYILVSKLNPETRRVWRPICLTTSTVCSTEFLAIKSKEPIMKEYVHSFVESDLFAQHLRKNASGSTNSRQRALPSEAMNCPVLIPPLNVVFKNTMAILLTSSELIKSNLRENNKLRAMGNYLLPRLISGEINILN